jgi:hypothetical protein
VCPPGSITGVPVMPMRGLRSLHDTSLALNGVPTLRCHRIAPVRGFRP